MVATKRGLMSGKKTESDPLLTDSQRDLLRGAVRSGAKSSVLAFSERQAIREIRVVLGDRAKEPEQLLVAFKSSLNRVANEAKLPFGADRRALINRFVTRFIEELYTPEGTSGTGAPGDSRRTGPVAFTPAETPGLSDARL